MSVPRACDGRDVTFKHLTLLAIALVATSACKQSTATSETKPAASAAAKAPQNAAGLPMRLDPSFVVAEWNGQKLTYGELMQKKESSFKKLHNKYLQDMHQAEQQEVEGMVLEQLVTAAAKAAGKTEQEYIQSSAGAATVTEAEILAFYDAQVKASGQPLEAVKERIVGFLQGQKQRDGVKAVLDKLKADAQFKMNIPAPETAKATFDLAGRPSKGPANAKVTMVEFSDFQCPYCSRAVPAVDAILKAYPNDVRVVFLHFPLNFHEQAMPSALAAQCANVQGKFWEFHDKLFANQGGLGTEMYAATAKEVGLDIEKFTACIADPATKAFVEADMKSAEAAGVEGTPSFYLNGVQTPGGPPTVEQIKALL